jgi:hypothetical protein
MLFGKPPLRLVLLTALLGITANAAPSIEPVDISHRKDWKVTPVDSDRVTLTETGGVLRVDYAVNINRPRLVGHITNREGGFTLELAKPIRLTPEQTRIYFEARSPETPEGFIAVRPLIEDANGERLSYVPVKERTFAKLPKGGGWGQWRTNVFNLTEAGGAAQELYDNEGGDLNAWPDGELRLIGFQVRVYASKDRRAEGKREGVLYIGDVATGGLELADVPFAYADALFKTKGDMRLAFQVRAAFQGMPVEESSTTLSYDPADEASRKQKVLAPLQSSQNSWARYRANGTDGSIESEGEFRWELNRAPGGESDLKPVAPSKPPVIGHVRINPERLKNPSEVDGIYSPDEPLRVIARVFPPKGIDAKNLRLEWKLTPYAFDTELAKGSLPVAIKGAYADIVIDLPREENRDAYQLQYTLVDDTGGTIDSGRHVLGISHPDIAARTTRIGTLRDRDDIKSRPYFRTTFIGSAGKFKSEKDEQENFTTMLRESIQLAQSITYMIDLADLEILPGVYDFRQVDTAMDIAADYGCGITIRLAHAEQEAPYRWLNYTTPRNFDGAPLDGHSFYGSYSMTDQRFVSSWVRAFSALHDRYKAHPAFEGYYVMQAGGEWAIPDQPWSGHLADYSWCAAEAFRTYLRDTRGFDLTALNQRWNTSYRSWDEVLPPQPTLADAGRPDLRPQWVDFQHCKISWRDGWLVNISKRIREYDPRRIIITYGGWDKVGLLAGLVDYFHNGGNHFLENEDTLVDAWEKDRLGWITEPHHPHRWAAYGDPAERGWILDWSVYVMTAQAGAGGQNLHVYYMPNPTMLLTAHYGKEYGLDRMELFKPVLRELHGMTLVRAPKQVAVIQDRETLLTKHRTTFNARLTDLRRWFDLLKQDSVDFEYYRPERENAYKLLVLNPLDEVMSRQTIDTAVRMAREGACVLVNARSGRYVADNAKEEFPLLRALGITPPQGEFEINRPNLVASFVEGRELVPGIATLPFFSQADFRAALKDPAVGANFFNWPYRWIPETDYFGYFPGVKASDGEVLARFSDGGAALSRHTVGKGSVIVFWGTADVQALNSQGLMGAIAKSAGVSNPRVGSAIPLVLEGYNDALKRRYALLYHETAGTFVQKLPSMPDGEWFVDDMVAGSRLGYVDGKTARETGVPFNFTPQTSPLKVLRFTPKKEMKSRWADKYGTLTP